MVDIPICFKKSPSLRMKNFELPILKFTNFLMHKGKREKIIRAVFSALRSFTSDFKLNFLNKSRLFTSWANYYFFISNTFYSFNDRGGRSSLNQSSTEINFDNTLPTFSSFLNSSTTVDLLYDAMSFKNKKIITGSFFFKNYLISRLNQTLPIFIYFIYSVDKNIKKYSRGKSGKYVFIWKYIAPYKRLKTAVKLIAKEIKFNTEKKLTNRIKGSFDELTHNPQNSFVWKAKIFSHNYVFKNFKKTLMTTLKTNS